MFQDQVQYKSLGLIIADEQHRFGVHQRLRPGQGRERQAESTSARHDGHTDTRTLAMSALCRPECSVISELAGSHAGEHSADIKLTARTGY